MPKYREDYVTDENGDERHPAFAVATVHRITATPGQVLFQSDVRHGEFIQVSVHEATRKRDLHHDWVHPGRVLLSFNLSLAQFASFVTSGGQGGGVPVTLEYDHGDVPGLNLAPRLALTAGEVKAAAHEAFKAVKAAEALYWDAVDAKAPAAVRKHLRANLQAAIRNAEPNVDFAAKRLAEHAEAVAEKLRADVEVMVMTAQQKAGIEIESDMTGYEQRALGIEE